MKISNFTKGSILIESITALLILLFVYTAVSKLLDPLFLSALILAPIVNKFAYFLVWFLPAIELIIALLLFIPRTRLLGLYSSLLILMIFTIYIIYIFLFLPKSMPCTCGGVIKQMTWGQHLIFNLFFVLIAIIGLILEKRKPKFPNSPNTGNIAIT